MRRNILVNITKLSLLLAFILIFNACEEDKDQWMYDGPALASFPNATTGDFFIEDKADASFTVDVALNTVSGSERTINVTVNEDLSTAVEGTHFTMPSTVTIPANQVIGELSISGKYADLPNVPLTLVIEIEGENSADYDNQFVLSLYKFVPFDLQNFVGTFECTEISYFGEFTYDVEVSAVEGQNAVSVVGFGAGMEAAYGLAKGQMNPIIVNFNTDDPASFSSYTEEAVAFTSDGVDSYYSATTGGLNTLSTSFSLGEFAIADPEGAWDIIEGANFAKK